MVTTGADCPPLVVNVQVGPVVVDVPSLTVTYHWYWVWGTRLDQVTEAVEPEGTVTEPISSYPAPPML